ncbi:MAG: hypothetical protein NDI60_05055 [Elusimicrobiales bacterium]|nr:hypothetical protein [Elusimicrobiales bacterium]
MKKLNLIALMTVLALMTTGAYAREASFEEILGGDSGNIIRGLNAAELTATEKISFPVPAGMESCKYSSVQGDVCSFTCKSGATVTRPRLNSSVAQNGGCPIMIMVPAGAPKAAPAAAIANGRYVNDSGCLVEAENGANGTVLYVEERGRRAMLGVLNNFSGGDIAAFCRPAAASFSGGVLTLGCQEQNNGGYSTRGTAELDLRGGLSAVRVRGEVKKPLGWKTDTNISCEGLRPVSKEKLSAKPGISGTYELKNGYGEGAVTVRQFSADGAEKAEFSLSTVAGPNAHTADISGVAVQTREGDFVFFGEDGCKISFTVSHRVLTVSGANATCGAYMGLNAIADGEYLKKN